MKLIKIYQKYTILVKAINFINLTNPSNNNPYHGIDHLFMVFKYAEKISTPIAEILDSKQQKFIQLKQVELLIAALFHDYGHIGKMGNDHNNIILAHEGVSIFHEANPEFDLDVVKFIIDCTEYPYGVDDKKLTNEGKMIRDADMSYLLEDISIVKLYSGLRKEFGFGYEQFMNSQVSFFNSVKFYTDDLEKTWQIEKPKRLLELKLLSENI